MSGPRSLVVRSALALGIAALLSTALLAGMRLATRERIEAQQRALEQASLAVLLPPGYDNDPVVDTITIDAPALDADDPVVVHRARRGGEPLGLVLTVVAPDGYAGDIRLLVGIDASNRVVGARVVAHAETPGLGDPIAGEWLTSFVGRALGDPPRERWTVRKEGGEFDQFAGATISPRAVVEAIARALDYAERHRDALYGYAERHREAPNGD